MYTAQPNRPQELRRQYSTDQIDTASNPYILTLCFDRLDRDMTVARDAIERGDHFATNESLRHAQDLLGEVAGMLDLDAWEHSRSLVALYDYVLRLLAKANLLKAEALVVEAQVIITEIGDAFRVAARPTNDAAPAASFADDRDRPRLSIQA